MPQQYQNQEQYPNNRPPVRQPPQSNFWRNLIIVVVALILVGGVIFAWISVKHPEWIGNEEGEPIEPTPTDGEGNKTALLWIIFILVGTLVLLVAYFLIKGTGKKGIETPKVPVSPDRAVICFKEHFSMNNHIESVYNSDKKVQAYEPANKLAIKINDKLPYYHTATGDNFLMLEVEVREGDSQGIHTIIIPIDRGEKTIQEGYYRVDTHTPKFQFQLNRVNYPMSSLQDKQERFRMAMMENMDTDKQQEAMGGMFGGQQPSITTPLDTFEGGEAGQSLIPPSQRRALPAPRRKYYTPRRRYY